MRENKQPPTPARYTDQLVIHSIFETIQGEGPLCGERALFIRLWGCNLRCPGCDTEYSDRQLVVNHAWMLNEAERRGWPQGALIVITGGEPFRQNIGPSIALLLRGGYRVQIETNGVLWHEGLDDVLYRYGAHDKFQIVCSPKTNRIHDRILSSTTAFKYVLRAGEVGEDGLPLKALMHPAAPQVARPRPDALVYVQPMDENDPAKNLLNLQAAIKSTMEFGHRLQIQVHKTINME